jgi:hypothetical protein
VKIKVNSKPKGLILMQFESHSHRAFSPVISSVTDEGNRLNGFYVFGGILPTALKRRCELDSGQTIRKGFNTFHFSPFY